MRTGAAMIALFVIATALLYAAALRPTAPSPLELPVGQLRLNKVPLTGALGSLGQMVGGGYVIFGVELWCEDGREPAISVDLPPGETLGGALRVILHSLPDYKYKVVSAHLVDIYPAAAPLKDWDALNIRVPRFDLVGRQAGDVLSRPKDFIPSLRAALEPRPPTSIVGSVLGEVGPPPIALHLRDVTVRQILNAVSEATESLPAQYGPLGWVCSFQPDPELPRGGSYTWRALFSTHYDWKPRTAAKPAGQRAN